MTVLSVGKREMATLVAALWYWKREGVLSGGHELAIASCGGEIDPLSADEIEDLGYRLIDSETDPSLVTALDRKEAASVLAALCYWTWESDMRSNVVEKHLKLLLSWGGKIPGLSGPEIDLLMERLRVAVVDQPPPWTTPNPKELDQTMAELHTALGALRMTNSTDAFHLKALVQRALEAYGAPPTSRGPDMRDATDGAGLRALLGRP
jgi:hypothetical protein